MKATAKANSNIALVKYWGKRDEKLILPQNSSISMTLDKLYTITTVEFNGKLKKDELIIDGKKVNENETERVQNHLDLIRKKLGERTFAKVESKNNFPKSAGLASSASGFAALTVASTKALDLHLDKRELSILARQGSGSASRSIDGGFVEWVKGSLEDGSDSYAKVIAPKEHWEELTMIVTILTEKGKKIKSREGMQKTVENSPMYKVWLETVEKDLDDMRHGILEKDFILLGKTAELNALKMHATMHTTKPPIIYWEPETIRLMKEVIAIREEGIDAYFTIDGGPQVKILCLEKNAAKIVERVSELKEVKKIIKCKAGEEAKLIDEDLF